MKSWPGTESPSSGWRSSGEPSRGRSVSFVAPSRKTEVTGSRVSVQEILQKQDELERRKQKASRYEELVRALGATPRRDRGGISAAAV